MCKYGELSAAVILKERSFSLLCCITRGAIEGQVIKSDNIIFVSAN